MKFKQFFILILSAGIFLSACGSDNDTKDKQTIGEAGKTVYEGSDFTIQIPKDWEVITRDSFTSNVPAETAVGFRNNIKSEIFTANLNVAEKSLGEKETLSTADFAKSSLTVIKKSLIGFEQKNEKEDKIDYGDENLPVYWLEFEGKKSPSEATIHFRQLYIVNNGIGYSVTAAYQQKEDESVVNSLNEMLNSFALK